MTLFGSIFIAFYNIYFIKMKNHIFNILSSIIAFYIPFQIAILTDLPIVTNLVLLIFCIQWIFFIPAFILQTENSLTSQEVLLT